MKVKFGDLTIRQAKELCEKRTSCFGCPIKACCSNAIPFYPSDIEDEDIESEIDLPDEEVKDDEALHNRV